MLATNPFAALSASIPPAVMQTYVLVMIALVVAGTLFDIVHKRQRKVLFRQLAPLEEQGAAIGRRRARIDRRADRSRGRPGVGEFCNARRRGAPADDVRVRAARRHHRGHGVRLPARSRAGTWWIGGVMVLVGGYWFWFFIRADVAAEEIRRFASCGGSVHPVASRERDARLVWAWLQARGSAAAIGVFALYPRHHGAVRIGAVVQVRAHVLQAGGVPEEGFLRERHEEQPARPRRQAGTVRQRANRPTPLL